VLTVLLATRNRSRIFASVLESFCTLRSPSSGWKLVIVDNGSTDSTHEIVRSYEKHLPLEYLLEPTLGKSAALNTGLGAVEGDLIIFADDDIFPNPNWLIQLRSAADANPEYSIFGGRILPRWEVPPPSWVQWVEQSPAYAVTDPLLKEGAVSPRLVYGPNMAIRANLFTAETRFNTSIGPRGTDYAQGTDMELIIRLSRQGHKAWYVADAVVDHLIRQEQMNKSWVMRRAVRFGRGEFRLGYSEGSKDSDQLPAEPGELVLGLFKEGLRILKATLLLRPERAFRCSWRFHYLRGQVMEATNLLRNHDSEPTTGSANRVLGRPGKPS
jgi:glycosyltransferase involved in cell wall biosynthesis